MCRIKEIREMFSISQTELAERAGVPLVTIAKLETEPKAITTVETLRRVSKALYPHIEDVFL